MEVFPLISKLKTLCTIKKNQWIQKSRYSYFYFRSLLFKKLHIQTLRLFWNSKRQLYVILNFHLNFFRKIMKLTCVVVKNYPIELFFPVFENSNIFQKKMSNWAFWKIKNERRIISQVTVKRSFLRYQNLL